MRARQRIVRAAIGAGAFSLALAAGIALRLALPDLGASPADAKTDPTIQGRKVGWSKQGKVEPGPSPKALAKLDRQGSSKAIVVLNGVRIMRISAPSGGMKPLARAQLVATRLQTAVDRGLTPGQVTARKVKGAWGVYAADTSLITVTSADARAQGTTAEGLARAWVKSTRAAIPSGGTSSQDSWAGWPGTPSEEWRPAEPYGDKWVPILSVLEGVRLGVARVNGPTSRLRYVQAVAQLETHWKDIVEIDIYLPISTKVPGKKLDRVEGCAVTGLADYRF